MSDSMENSMKRAIPLSYCLGFSTFSLSESVLETIKKHWLQNAGHDCVRVSGLLIGYRKGTNIYVDKCEQFDAENFPKDVSGIDSFLGVYSDGDIPNDQDVSIIYTAFKTVRSSIFLFKFDSPSGSNDLSTSVFECAIHDFKSQESLYLIQAYSHRLCANFIDDSGSSNKKNIKQQLVFDIGFQCTPFDIAKRLELLQISEVQKHKIMTNVKQMNGSSFRELKKTIFQIARDEDVAAKYPRDYYYSPSTPRELDAHIITDAKELCRKAKTDFSYVFDIRFENSIRKSVFCIIKIKDLYLMNMGDDIKDSQISATYHLLFDFFSTGV